MHHALAAVTGTPTPTAEVDPDLVSPGVWGFVIVVLVAVAVVLLVMDMMRRIRRGRVRADIAEELDARARETEGESADGGQERPEGDRPAG